MRAILHDASDPELGGPYDSITIFEPLHDMNHPIEALRPGALNRSATRSSAITVRITRPRPGFGRVEVLPIEHGFWRFYRLVP